MLGKDSFKLVYMPIYDVVMQRVMSFEALLRIEGSNTAHMAVLDKAEMTGSIVDIDIWVLEKVASFLRRSQDSGLCISVNVSPVTIDTGLPRYLSTVMRHMDVAERVIFEITETQPILTIDKVNLFSQGIKLVDGRLSLDDFGDGHFLNLDILPEVNADFIKLSGFYMSKVYTEPLLLTKLISKLPSNCHLIAEFVDSKERLDFLLPNGVRYAQGYYIGQPGQLSLHQELLLVK